MSANQTLLRLSARGEALIAELLRLSDHTPTLFLLADKAEQKLYQDVLLDFRYLKSPELYEHRIEASAELVERDEDVWLTHGPLIDRFFGLFESIYKYIKDFARCLQDLREGVYIQQTVEGVLLDEDGKQLMCEALYLYGVMLLLMDARIEGAVRERLLVAYYRHRGASTIESIDDVCLLVRATGYSPTVLDRSGMVRRPPNYPEEYFLRIPNRAGIPNALVQMMIARLRSEDMYGQISSYPLPQHRSTALSTQARMLFVLLYFAPEVLDAEQHTMREIVDRHFADNWVITYYMGFVVQLSHAWEPYKAARAALANTTTAANTRALYAAYGERIGECKALLQHRLTEGVLTEEYVLEATPDLIHCARECNVTIRWLMLHRRERPRRGASVDAAAAAEASREAEQLLLLIMNTSQFEYNLRKLISSLLERKETMWAECRAQADERLLELADFFSGTKALTRVGKDAQLQEWFGQLATQVRALDSADATSAGRKMHHMIGALSEVEQFHQIEAALQIKQFLQETRELLQRMIRVVNVRESTLVTLSVVSDMSYAWESIDDYTELMRSRIERDPFCVLKLRATFLKLVSILDSPLVRINQANSPDLHSVSQYYSSELVAYVRRVLQVIPENMFAILFEVVQLQAHELAQLPVKVVRTELREWSQLDARHRLARHTHRVSVLTEGVLNMHTTLLGVIKVDPKELLHDGIRQEIVRQVVLALHAALHFRQGKPAEVEAALGALIAKLEGFQLALEYISDYVKICGLKLWHEEFARVVLFLVEQERNAFLKKKVLPRDSRYQSPVAPIEPPPAAAGAAGNGVGRLLRELLYVTATRRATYVEDIGAWCDAQGRELVGARMFSLLHQCLGCAGLRGLDSLLSCMIARQLNLFVRAYRAALLGDAHGALERLASQLEPPPILPEKLPKLYSATADALKRLWPELIETVARCGTAQLLRRHIGAQLGTTAKRDSGLLRATLAAANRAAIADARSANGASVGAGAEVAVIGSIARYSASAGLGTAELQVFITGERLPLLPLALAVFTCSQLGKMSWSGSLATLVGSSSSRSQEEVLDGAPFALGIATLLRQFHESCAAEYVALLSQHVRAVLHGSIGRDARGAELPPEATLELRFLAAVGRHLGFPLSDLVSQSVLRGS